ncbi:hypothetical protein QBC35DRAFT_450261 [Podospora australis]|uniref:F-box domain-containing protein n=1 Tax=Podospora australis TaxID=1536484 RepID=A0AAN6WXF7_9PEZI|nr:hypothetical protein QBC35DRAFT_450261 [Podospora australis]
MAPFERLPAELMLQIAYCVEENSNGRPGDLNALSRVNKKCRQWLTSILYGQYGERAIEWGAEHGSLPAIQTALLYAQDDSQRLSWVNSRFQVQRVPNTNGTGVVPNYVLLELLPYEPQATPFTPRICTRL